MPPESNPLLSQRAPPNPASSKTMVTSSMRVRLATLFAAALNLAVAILGPSLHRLVLRTCGRREKIAVIAASSVAFLRIGLMIGAGMAQASTAAAIAAGALAEGGRAEDDGCRRVVRTRYKKWLWWTRFGMVIIALQFMMALYVMFIIAKDLSYSGGDIACFLGQDVEDRGWKRILMVSFLVLLWLVVIIQCVMGSDILRWRSYYATHDTAWKAHYREVFDHGIREALCCMGRHKYLSVLEEDEVYSVARLLGDLVAYRASGTGHLEFLAGLALLQRQKRSPKPPCDLVEAPEALLQEAVSFHQFSEAAYTGPLLDIGRNPVLFPCAWLHRQAVLTPWTRSRRPILEGDNWWRGHAAAFIKCVNLPPEALHRGRVIQRKREAAYFIVVLHDLSSVVIAVRGTETPEDLLTDALCRECSLSIDDLDGLINTDQLPLGIKETVLSTFPHYGHSGIVESARELFEQIDGHPIGKDESSSEKPGFLSSLMGNGRECGGYKLIIVGHSLGGAVATFLGIRLHARYPNLHVYAYGPLPCVDSVIAEACSGFVTCIVHNDEFSSRLSINSIHRLRAAAITALSDESAADSAIISKFTRRILYSRDKQETGEIQRSPPTSTQHSPNVVEEDGAHIYQRRHMKYSIRGGAFLCGHTFSCVTPPNYCPSSRVMDVSTIEIGDISENASYDNSDSESTFVNVNFREERHYESESSEDLSTCKGHESSCLMDTSSSPNEVVSVAELPPVFLAGLIVHIVPEEKKASPYWKSWLDENSVGYKAFISNREFFKDIVVSPYMFLDHLPWRCHYALQRVIQTRKYQAQLRSDLMNGEVLV